MKADKRKAEYIRKEKEYKKIDKAHEIYTLAKDRIKDNDYNGALILLKRLKKSLDLFEEEAIRKNILFEYYKTLGILKYTDESVKGIITLLSDELAEAKSITTHIGIYWLELANAYYHGSRFKEAKKYYNELIKKGILVNDAHLKLCYIAMQENDYETALEHIQKVDCDGKISHKFVDAQKETVIYYIKKKLNIPREYTYDFQVNHGYHMSQLECYGEEQAILHINKHIGNEDYDEDEKLGSFLSNIEIGKLFYEVKDLINPENLLVSSGIDKYVISLGKTIGRTGGNQTDSVCAITFPAEPEKILTIYPCIRLDFNKRVRK